MGGGGGGVYNFFTLSVGGQSLRPLSIVLKSQLIFLSLVGIFFLDLPVVTSSNVFSGRYNLLSNQNTGVAKQQRGYLFYTNTVIPHKTSQQAHARLATTLDLRHSCINTRPLP